MGETSPPTAADYAHYNASVAMASAKSVQAQLDYLYRVLEARGVLTPNELPILKQLRGMR